MGYEAPPVHLGPQYIAGYAPMSNCASTVILFQWWMSRAEGVEARLGMDECNPAAGWLVRMLAGEKVDSFVAIHNAILQLLKV